MSTTEYELLSGLALLSIASELTQELNLKVVVRDVDTKKGEKSILNKTYLRV